MLPENMLGLVIADVCDKGVGSALFMALFRSLIRVFSGKIKLQGVSVPGWIRAEPDPRGDFLDEALNAVAMTNDYIAEEHGEEGMFATLFFGVLNPLTGSMAYINAGHEPLFIINSSGVKEQLNSTGPVVGIMPKMAYTVRQIQLEPGDTLIGYTDGVTEAMSPQETLFGKRRFQALLERPTPTASVLIEQIKYELFQHIDNAPQFDDITMIAIHRESDGVDE
jgi:sigma-B regulation protein RsbU (phosphoserine phosphatase)